MTDKTLGAYQRHEKHDAPVRECPDLDVHWRYDEAQETIQRLTKERDEMRAAEPRPLTPDDITDEMVRRALDAYGRENTPTTTLAGLAMREALTAALTVPTRPEWTDTPAVRAWHKHDGRTEHDGTPGVKRIWSPDYGTTDTWSTPSLRNVPWSDLVDVEPLGVRVEGSGR